MNAGYDIAIIGGGPVGAALALALRGSKLRICVLEARPANAASADARALALSYGSRLLLNRLGVWNSLRDVSPIHTIHISQKQSFGRAVLHAEELNVPELGYVIPYPALQDALTDALQHTLSPNLSPARGRGKRDSAEEGSGKLQYITGASVTHLQGETDHAVIGYQQDGAKHTLNPRLAVVADGGKLLAQQFPPKVRDYGQSALITHITCSSPQAKTAFERFTPQGPLALLPFKEGYELVWTAPHQAAQEMLAWDDAKFLHELHQHFGDRVGEFLTVSKRTCFPLGLSDAWELSQAILDAKPEELGSEAMLATYRADRRTDREAGIRFTDSLVRLFSNDLPLISTGRAAALTVLDCLPFVKKFVAKRMMFGANG